MTKRYDSPKTPYQRVLEAERVPRERKSEIRSIYLKLDLAGLKGEIERLQEELNRCVRAKRENKERRRVAV